MAMTGRQEMLVMCVNYFHNHRHNVTVLKIIEIAGEFKNYLSPSAFRWTCTAKHNTLRKFADEVQWHLDQNLIIDDSDFAPGGLYWKRKRPRQLAPIEILIRTNGWGKPRPNRLKPT